MVDWYSDVLYAIYTEAIMLSMHDMLCKPRNDTSLEARYTPRRQSSHIGARSSGKVVDSTILKQVT